MPTSRRTGTTYPANLTAVDGGGRDKLDRVEANHAGQLEQPASLSFRARLDADEPRLNMTAALKSKAEFDKLFPHLPPLP
jgi:hypothetical protein